MTWRDRCLDYTLDVALFVKNVLESIIRFVGPFFVALAFILLSGSIYFFFAAIFPYHIPNPFSIYGMAHLLWCSFLLQGLVFNYVLAIITPAGTPPPPVR